MSLEGTLLVGVTDFVLARAQEEVIQFVVRDFSKKICEDDRAYFSNACAVLSGTAGSEPADLRSLSSAFEKGLEQDLKLLPEKLFEGLDDDRGPLTEAVKIGRGLYEVLEEVKRGAPALATVATVCTRSSFVCAGDADDKACWVRFVGLVAQTLNKYRQRIVLADPQDLQEWSLLTQTVSVRLVNVLKKEFGDELPPALAHVGSAEALKDRVSSMLAPTRRLLGNVERLLQDGDEVTSEERWGLIRLVVGDLTLVFEGSLPTEEEPGKRALQGLEGIRRAWIAVEERAFDELVAAMYAIAAAFEIDLPLGTETQRYIPLITALTTAKEPADIEAALKKYAAPAGSWRGKQDEGARTVSLTAFAGFGASNVDDDGGSFDQAGLFLPIGLDWTWNRPRRTGLFLSFIDIGNLATVRLDEGELVEPELDEVFSPGVYLRHSVKKTPFVVGVGAAWVRRVEDVGGEQIGRTRRQVGAFVAVDVTLWMLNRSGPK